MTIQGQAIDWSKVSLVAGAIGAVAGAITAIATSVPTIKTAIKSMKDEATDDDPRPTDQGH